MSGQLGRLAVASDFPRVGLALGLHADPSGRPGPADGEARLFPCDPPEARVGIQSGFDAGPERFVVHGTSTPETGGDSKEIGRIGILLYRGVITGMAADSKYEPGTLVWCLGMFGDAAPAAAKILEDHGQDGLYAFHFEYEHNVYLVREDTYLSPEAARAGAMAKRVAYEAAYDAETDRIVALFLSEPGQEPRLEESESESDEPKASDV